MNQQNHPLIASATTTGSDLAVQGSFSGAANATVRLEFFAVPTADASGHGEAAVWLGALDVTTDASGQATWSAPLTSVNVPTGHWVSATATQVLGAGVFGSTSVLSAAVAVTEVNVAPVIAGSRRGGRQRPPKRKTARRPSSPATATCPHRP